MKSMIIEEKNKQEYDSFVLKVADSAGAELSQSSDWQKLS